MHSHSHMNMIRLSAFLLSALILTSSVACATETSDKNTSSDTLETGSGSGSGPADESESVDPHSICDLPADLDYGGTSVGILYADASEFVGEMGGGLVSGAVYERNIQVEEDLGVHFEFYQKKAAEVIPTMQADIMSGDGTYDIVANSTYLIIQSALDGLYVNLTALENINTAKTYWSQGYNEMLTFTDENLQFLASGPIALSTYRYPFLTVYNKQLFEDYHIPDLYHTVQNGDWTLDYQYAISSGHYVDKDGDGVHSDGDQYGFVSGNVINIDPYADCADIHMIIKDPVTGELIWNNEALATLADLCDKVQKLYNDESTYIYRTASVSHTRIIEHFTEGNALMATTMFREIEMYCDQLTNLSYGVAPMPKFEKAQNGYRTRVQDAASGVGISSAVTDSDRQEMVAAVLESMAYHSNQITRPAYYEDTLTARFMQDPQSAETVDLIFASIRFDFARALYGEYRDSLRPMLSGKENTVASSTRMWGTKASRRLRELNQALEKLTDMSVVG